MKTFIDIEGKTLKAQQLEGPTMLNTINGERCAEKGDWILELPTGGITTLDNDTFLISFKELSE